jgi:serine/threonine protein kinase
MSDIQFSCLECKAVLEAEHNQIGSAVVCPSCNVENKVPPYGVIPGMKIGDFVVEKRLGMGGMGEVWLADQPGMQRNVALKILSPDFTANSEFVARFMQEAKLAGKLIHPNIVTAHHAGKDNNLYYLAISFVDGVELDELLKTEGIMNESKALPIIRNIAQSLKYAWDKFQILHRDIKPGNIMIDKDGTAMLMDMGISKSLSENVSMTITGTMVGTPAYISPEQAKGEKDIDFRADMYSLGATLYFMVTGELPFEAETAMATVSKHLTEDLPDCQELNPQITDSCKHLIEKMMAKKKDDRYLSWDELIKAVDDILSRKKTEIDFCCPKCTAALSIDAEFVNHTITCPNCNSEQVVPNFGIVPGMQIGDFVVEKKLGIGGMGEVWLADQPAMQRKVALKVLSPELSEDLDFSRRFMREAKMAGKLIHPNIITAYHAGIDNRVRYLAISYIDGYVLCDLMKAEKTMDEKKALKIVYEIGTALQYAWDKFNMLHRDIKPDNIMIDKDDTAMLMDMGISKITTEDASLTSIGTMVGTPAYISPEQATGDKDIDFRADLYSLGATLFQMLTDAFPFDADSGMEIVSMQINEPLPDCRKINPAISKECKNLIDKMMMKDRYSRHASWKEFLDDIDKIMAGETLAKAQKKNGILRLITVGAVALTLLLGGAFFWIMNQLEQKPEASENDFGIAETLEDDDEKPPEIIKPLPPKPQDTEKIKEMAVAWALAEQFTLTHKNDYNTSIAKYQEILEKYPSSEYEEKAKAKIKSLQEAKKEAIAIQIKDFKTQVQAEAKKHNYDKAITDLKDYQGFGQKETAAVREGLIMDLENKKAVYLATKASSPPPPAIPKLTSEQQLLSSVSKALLLGKIKEAKTFFEQSPVKAKYPNISKTLKDISNMPDILKTQLGKEIGNKIEVEENDQKVAYPLKKISKGYLYLTIKKGRVTTVKKYSTKSIPFDKKISYLQKADTDPVALAVIQTNYFFKKGDFAKSIQEAGKAQYLSESLKTAINEESDKRAQKNAEKGLNKILGQVGFNDQPINQGKVTVGLKTLKLGPAHAKNLLQKIEEFKEAPATADYALLKQDFISQLETALQRILKNKDEELFKDLKKRLGTSDAVTKKLIPIIKDFHKKLKEVKANGSDPHHLGRQVHRKVDNILPHDKLPAFDQYQREEMEKYGLEAPRPPRPPGPPRR